MVARAMRFGVLAAALFFIAAGPASAATVSIDFSRVYTITSLGDGDGPYAAIGGQTGSPNDYYRTLVDFDIAGEVPSGATINEATLRLYYPDPSGDPFGIGLTASANTLTSAWTTDATWTTSD